MSIPTNLPKLKGGIGAPGSGEVCAEQAVNWLVSGRLDLGDETDHPSCVQPVLNRLSIHDVLVDEYARQSRLSPAQTNRVLGAVCDDKKGLTSWRHVFLRGVEWVQPRGVVSLAFSPVCSSELGYPNA